jgi:hypothetical protein
VLPLALCAGMLMSGCAENTPSSKAFRAESPSQLIGGDVAMARVGDFILENDVIRVAILDVASSPGPGVYGGTLVDADLQRTDAQFRNGSGHDQFSEMFPFANLLTPRPEKDDVEIIDDGSGGGDAIVRVSGDGLFILDALKVFGVQLMNELFGDLKMNIRIQTDYILSPGASYVRMVTRITRLSLVPSTCGNGVCESTNEETFDSCPEDCEDPDGLIATLLTCREESSSDISCAAECEFGLRHDTQTGCPVVPCECASEGVGILHNFEEQTSIFGGLLGEKPGGGRALPGMVGGDFVFFGGQNNLFAPGMGFDEDRPIFDGLFEGRDPFNFPVTFDYMAAAGGAVSYGYFSANAPGEVAPRVLVPIITSSTTAFTTAAHNCYLCGSVTSEGECVDGEFRRCDNGTLVTTPCEGGTCEGCTGGDLPAEGPDCESYGQWEFERYFVVGKGDIGSIADVVYEVRGTPVGTLEGSVLDALVGPAANAKVFILHDPDPEAAWGDVREVIDANWNALGEPGVLNAVDADVGLDPVEDGDFRADLPEGSYLVVATNAKMTATSEVYRVDIEVGEVTRLNPILPKPATLRYRVTDGLGQRIESKLVLVSVDDQGELATDDGLRRPALGEGRIGNGIRHMDLNESGDGSMEIEPGRYRLFVTHGPLYSRGEVDFSVGAGEEHVVQVTLHKEVDTGPWIGLDAHLHAEPSHDSGVKLERRVISAVAEGLDLAVSTDHDVVTDYAPTIAALGLRDRIKSAPGVEVTTLELGHFIAFPLDYNHLDSPGHNAPDWWCKDGQEIMDELTEHFEPGQEGVRIMAHPRDGFFGYISQLEVDAFDLTRANLNTKKAPTFGEILFGDYTKPGGPDLLVLEGGNALLSKATCDYEAMEVFNSKRFDLIRTPTNAEVITFNACMFEIERLEEGDIAGLEASCADHKGDAVIPACESDERFFDCKMRHRRALAKEVARRILVRTPEEQELIWNHQPDPAQDERRCEPFPSDLQDLDPPQAQDPALIPAEDAGRPCTRFAGTVDDWMRWLDKGLNVTLTAASDSHGTKHEPGTPRTWVRHGAVSTATEIDVQEVVRALKGHNAVPSFGPVIDATISSQGPGDTVAVSPGAEMTMKLRVQSASWFGVDRIEVYVSGELQHALDLDNGPELVVDYEGELTLTAPEEDAFVFVIAVGIKDENLMGPTYLDVPFGELQLTRIASLAFGSLPGLESYFPPTSSVPDFFPVFPLAMTNAILIDVDGDGWAPQGPGPAFCSRPCDLGAEVSECPGDQVCLTPDAVCGYPIPNMCLPEPNVEEDGASGSVE